MAKLVVTTFVSIDGVMQAPGGPGEDDSGSFRHGGWLVPYVDDEMLGFMADVFSRADAFLLGRSTYQTFAAHWPRVANADDPIACPLNALPKHVASTSLRSLDWKGSSLIDGDVVQAVGPLKRRYDRELQVHGSAGLLQTLIANDLVDEYHILQFPVVLGSGKRLFGAGAAPGAMMLVRSRTSPAGTVMSTYRRAGKPAYGSFALDQ